MEGFEWRPGIGDPTPIGWITTLAYLVTAYLCLRAFRLEKAGPERSVLATVPAAFRVLWKHWPDPPPRARRAVLWILLSFAFVLLGVNKQLDLQTLVTDLGRATAFAMGWYDQRRGVQLAFVALVLLVGLVAVGLFFVIARGQLRDMRLPLGGLAFVVTFVIVRAASFHDVEELVWSDVCGLRMEWALELGGIALVALGAIRRVRRGERALP